MSPALPAVGGDSNVWGTELNAWLLAAHNADGTPANLFPVAVQTTNYTATANQLVPVDTTSGSSTVTLPAAPVNGTQLCVKMVIQGNTGNIPNTVTVAASGTDVFNKAGGSTSVILKLSGQGVFLEYLSGIWYVVSDDLPLGQLDNRYQTFFNVKFYGAVGNGIADDTAAIQAAINAVTGAASPVTTTRAALGILYFPPGNYKVTSDLIIRSTDGFKLVGAGINQTIIYASGTAFTQAVIFINGCADGVFEGFDLRGDGTEQVNDGIRLDWVTASRADPGCVTNSTTLVANTDARTYDVGGTVTGAGIPAATTVVSVVPNVSWTLSNAATASATVTLTLASLNAAARSTTGNHFRDIRVRTLKAVTLVSLEGNSTVQVDGTLFENVIVSGSQTPGSWSSSGNWQKGFSFGCGVFANNYDHVLTASTAADCYYGVHCNVSSVTITGTQPAGNFCEFYIRPGAQTTIKNVQSQNSGQILTMDQALVPIPVSLEDVEFVTVYPANVSPYTMVTQNGGNLSIKGFQGWVFASSAFQAPAIAVNGYSGKPAHTTLSSVALQGAAQSCIIPQSGFANVLVQNYTNYNAGTGVYTAPVAGDLASVYTGGAWISLDQAAGTITVPQVNLFTAGGTWTKPAGAQMVHVTVVPGAGGAGSGASGASGTVQSGGAGGSPGGMLTREFVASDLGATVTVTVGGGGNGGASVTGSSGSTPGNAGSVGTNSTFGTHLTGVLGLPGAGGTTTAAAGGLSPIGTSAAQAGAGAASSGTGGAGVGVTSPAVPLPPGGPSGGGITTGAVAGAGAAGATSYLTPNAVAGGAGVVGGATPTAGTASPDVYGSVGPSPGSGAASTTGAAQAGADARANSGAGGAGGGASLNGSASGKGGNGGSGWVLVITYFQ